MKINSTVKLYPTARVGEVAEMIYRTIHRLFLPEYSDSAEKS